MEKDLERFEEGPKSKIYIDLLRATLKKYQIGKRPALMGCLDSVLKKPTSIYDRLAIKINRCL